jgi:hypothetical protein
LLPTNTGDRYDGASLHAYEPGITVGEMTLFHLKANAKP